MSPVEARYANVTDSTVPSGRVGGSFGRTETVSARPTAWRYDRPTLTSGLPSSGNSAEQEKEVGFEPVISVNGNVPPVANDENNWAMATVLNTAPELVTCEVNVGGQSWE